jgi:hypothetical protein
MSFFIKTLNPENLWRSQQDSNLQSSAPEADALSIKLWELSFAFDFAPAPYGHQIFSGVQIQVQIRINQLAHFGRS